MKFLPRVFDIKRVALYNMKKLFLTFCMVVGLGGCLFASDSARLVKDFIKSVDNNDRKELADNSVYPLGRPRNAIHINSEDDFLDNYDVLFDKDFIKKIVSSDAKDDWSTVGVQGIMFENGDIWLDIDGKLIAINHITEEEQKQIDAAILKDKESLPESLQNYKENMLKFRTEKYIVRVDLLYNDKFRYAAWRIERSAVVASEPDIVLYDGERIFEGSGGNNHYVFTRDNYRYEIYENVIGEADQKPYELKVYKNNELILSQSNY